MLGERVSPCQNGGQLHRYGFGVNTWTPDVLGRPYEQSTIELGDDPDGEGRIRATLVRRRWASRKPPRGAVLYVHGFTDYFFQREMADFWAKRGYAFFALDLRKCGRSRDETHTPHYVSTLEHYDAELDEAVRIIAGETDGVPLVVSAHSTGGLIVPLWLDRRNRESGGTPGGASGRGIVGVVLNSPWFDLQGPWLGRSVGTWAVSGMSKLKPLAVLPLPGGPGYGRTLHTSTGGEWEFDIAWKPLDGFPVTVGWLAAVREGHLALHKGLDIGVPSLVLRSARSHFVMKPGESIRDADIVLDVNQIGRWAGCLGNAVTSIPVEGAMHDIFLSSSEVRAEAYRVVGRWLTTFVA